MDRLRENGRRSLFYFLRGLCGNHDLNADIHYDLCNTLQGGKGDWTRLFIVGFRGCLKTTCVTKGYLPWYLLYNENTSGLLVEQKADNAAAHLEEIQHLLKTANGGILLEMFSDRIPAGLVGWNSEQICFNRSDPLAPVSLRIGGIASKYEGVHVNLIVCNDLEGADAEKSDAPNADARRFLFNRATPLLIDPGRDRILGEGTPHGAQPLVWTLRELDAGAPIEWDKRTSWKLWWQPLLDENGESTWKERFTKEVVVGLQQAAASTQEGSRMLQQQYQLKKDVELGGGFDMDRISEMYYRRRGGQFLEYPAIVLPETDFERDEFGTPIFEYERRVSAIGAMRRYIHIDPTHRRREELRHPNQKPSVHAIVVVGISWDYHAFVLDTWIRDGSLTELLKASFRLYRKWRPQWVTCEMVGAQVWYVDAVKQAEKFEYSTIVSPATPWDPNPAFLPRMSARIKEAHREGTDKDFYIMQSLEAWHGWGWIHLHPSQEALIEHHRVFPTETSEIDGVDALAQGPPVWTPPLSPATKKELLRRRHFIEKLRDPKTGYGTPWLQQELATDPPPPQQDLSVN